MPEKVLQTWLNSIEDLGPYRTGPDGTLYVYADPKLADAGEPCGIYVPAEEEVRRVLTHVHGEEWTTQRRNEVLNFLKDQAARVFDEVNVPLIPCMSGVLDLSQAEDGARPDMHEHSPFWGFTAQIPHEWDPDATCPKIHAFLLEACAGDEEAVEFIYELIGYTILPFQFLRKAVMVTGPSGTGKSTVLFLVERLVGMHNASYVPLQAIGEDRFATSDLFGKLVNIGGDIDATEIKQTGMFKSLTGDDYVRADVKYGKPIRFRSGATCWFAANEPPASRDHTDAWRERWVILPFNTKPAKTDFTLKAKLTTEAEMQGLFRHAVEGAANLLLRGSLLQPASVREAHAAFARSTDQIQSFLGYIQDTRPKQRVSPQDLTAQYKAWADAEGIRPVRRQVLLTRATEAWGMIDQHFQIPEG